MIRVIIIQILFASFLFCQTTANFSVEQRDSVYYLLSSDGITKFYSPGSEGVFYFIDKLSGEFTATTKFTFNDQHFFLYHEDSLYFFLDSDANEFLLLSSSFLDNPPTELYGFGPYLIIESDNIYGIYKVENESILTIEDSLFYETSNNVFFSYPFIVRPNSIYKFLEGFGLYNAYNFIPGWTNQRIGIRKNKLYSHILIIGWPPIFEDSYLYIRTIQEPDFPVVIQEDWGSNNQQIGNCSTLDPNEKLFYFYNGSSVVTNIYGGNVYIPDGSARVSVTDYYIFLLDTDIRFSIYTTPSIFNYLVWENTSGLENDINVKDYKLYQNFPNPFNGITNIVFQLPGRENVSIKIYDVLGREIWELANREFNAGTHKVQFDASEISSGVYFYQVKTNNFTKFRKMNLLK